MELIKKQLKHFGELTQCIPGVREVVSSNTPICRIGAARPCNFWAIVTAEIRRRRESPIRNVLLYHEPHQKPSHNRKITNSFTIAFGTLILANHGCLDHILNTHRLLIKHLSLITNRYYACISQLVEHLLIIAVYA